jgi:hypothetical protein
VQDTRCWPTIKIEPSSTEDDEILTGLYHGGAQWRIVGIDTPWCREHHQTLRENQARPYNLLSQEFAVRLRDALRQISAKLGQEGLYSHDDVIEELRREHPKTIKEYSRTLEDVALKRMLSDIDSRQVRKYDPAQGELFSELAGIPASFSAKGLGLSNKSGARVLNHRLNVRQLRSIAYAAEKPRLASSFKTKILEVLDQLKDFIASEEEEIGAILKRSRGQS